MSLYGGIKFSAAELQAQADAKAASGEPKEVTKTEPPGSSTAQSDKVKSVPVTSASNAKGSSAVEWSAALKFAPRIPKARPAAAPRSNIPTTSYIAPPVIIASDAAIIKLAESFKDDPPVTAKSKGKEKVVVEVVLGPDGKPLPRAPAMTIIGGQWKRKKKGNKVVKREYRRDDEDGGKKRKKKKKKQQTYIAQQFDPEEDYDPNRPNDLGEYQAYRRRAKEERRAVLMEEKRRKAAGESSEEGSSYYTDSEEEAAPRRDAPKMFAPPRMYSPPRSTFSAPPLPKAEEPTASLAAASGDDAYARRMAMSQAVSGELASTRRAAPAASGDDAYARRQVSSTNIPISTAPAPPDGVPVPPSPTKSTFTAPSLSMLSGAPPSLPPSTFIAPSTGMLASAPSPIDPGILLIPGFGAHLNPHPTPPPVPTLTPVPNSAEDDFVKNLEERKKAAEAIAYKFRKMAEANGDAPIPLAEIEGASFAEKLMKRWGHKEGSGLGTKGEGIVHALTVEHVVNPKDAANLTKRQLAKQKAAAANAKQKKWVQNPNARGKIINANNGREEGGDAEAGRVVCLVGLVNGVEEVDEELSEEIGEECSKLGVVERVVLHMVEPPPEDPRECLRVFVVFSGMAGAWRAVKELDGRFFGGGKIRATYYDETKFDSGDRDEIIS